MKNFHTEKLAELWHKGVNLYKFGHQDPAVFPIAEDLPFLKSMGMNKMDIFDFAEDWVREGEPDLASFLLIHEHRRDYFWEVQNRIESSVRLNSSSLPAKDAEIGGVRWLPRIIPKAKAKLRGGTANRDHVLLRRRPVFLSAEQNSSLGISWSRPTGR